MKQKNLKKNSDMENKEAEKFSDDEDDDDDNDSTRYKIGEDSKL